MAVYTEDRIPIRETILGSTALYNYLWAWDWTVQQKVVVAPEDPIAPPTFNPNEKIRTTIAEKMKQEFVTNGHALQIEAITVSSVAWAYKGRTHVGVDLSYDLWEITGHSDINFLTDMESNSVSLALIALLSTIIPIIAYVIIAYFVSVVFETVNETVELLVDPDPPETYVCPYCGLEFETGQALTAHIKLKHPNENAYICGICGADFATAEELAAHKEEAHPEDGYSLNLLIVAAVIALIVIGAIAIVFLRGKRG